MEMREDAEKEINKAKRIAQFEKERQAQLAAQV